MTLKASRKSSKRRATLDELRQIGTRQKEFEMVTRQEGSYTEYSLRITPYHSTIRSYSGLNRNPWALYAQVQQVFERHPLWWKRILKEIASHVPWWVLVLPSIAGIFLDVFLPQPTGKAHPISPIGIGMIIAIFLFILTSVYLTFFEDSIVVLRYSHESRWPKLKEYAPQFVSAILAAIVGALIAAFIKRK